MFSRRALNTSQRRNDAQANGINIAFLEQLAARAFVPTDLAGLELWLRADLGITLNGGTVSAWADQSGKGDANRNVVQATGSKQPTYTASDSTIAGHPSLAFTRASVQCLKSGAFSASISQPFTLFLVGQTDRAAGQTFFDGNTVGGRCEAYTDATSNKMYAGSAFITMADNSTNPRIMVYELDGANSKIYTSSKTAGVTGDPGAQALAGVTIGAAFDAASDALGGMVAEVILKSGVDVVTREICMNYLSNRYAVALS